MTFPVMIEANDDRFTATILGAPAIRAEAPTRDQAIALIKKTLSERVRQGELIFLDIDAGGLSGLAGRFASDPTLREICEEAYRLRDADIVP